ncbi:hypothetical protein CRG98_018856 [Punica granatum]|uniref:Uncharacterized protein n=1 Tax=Punica granatum TaxID=22663 RepID=A0A2I0JZ63_PUNGR|nr:hypothetical protein CRG98_018856 [Punica granatum]
MLYLASGYEVRVVEVFESRVTRLNAWKSARVQRMHVQARMRAGGARAHGRARGRAACARIFWLREGKLASCIEEEEEASRAKGDSSWAARGSHNRRGETGKKLGYRLIAHSRLVVQIEC